MSLKTSVGQFIETCVTTLIVIGISTTGVADGLLALEPTATSQEDEFEGIPAFERKIDDDPRKTYFQIGPREAEEQPENGWKVLLILPGGDGSADFHPFCRRIHQHALPEDFVVAQLVAPVWKDDENRTVWPSRYIDPDDGDFITEDFIKATIDHLRTEIEIDDRYIFAMGWSSGGPAVYSDSVTDDSPVTGSFVAMSVFRPRWMDDLDNAKDHPFFILHSPDDWIDFDDHAVAAELRLREHEAVVRLKTYRGGHGWRDDPFGNIRTGVNWLSEQVDQ